jgi:hypothetical protein
VKRVSVECKLFDIEELRDCSTFIATVRLPTVQSVINKEGLSL